MVKKVKEETGLMTATEVANKDHVKLALSTMSIYLDWGAFYRKSIHYARNCRCFEGTDKIVLVKNPVNPDLALWLGGVERCIPQTLKI